ncbi:recombinase family protein, partial [Aeromonas lacus]|uniref:recombinase family protein n=1 Tax=Aeromonas lacus TaxID=558884 RepID=UPI001377E0F8
MKAYIYARISSAQQKQGAGLDRQTQDALLYCKNKNLVVQEVQQDIASAYHARHLEGKLGVFLQAVKDKLVEVPSALVVESLDRLGRDHELKALSRFIDIVEQGIEIHEMSTGVVYNRQDTHLLHLAVAVMSR